MGHLDLKMPYFSLCVIFSRSSPTFHERKRVPFQMPQFIVAPLSGAVQIVQIDIDRTAWAIDTNGDRDVVSRGGVSMNQVLGTRHA